MADVTPDAVKASERLRELATPNEIEAIDWPAKSREEYFASESEHRKRIRAVLAALPLIALVVEAAEWAVLNAQLVCDEEIVLDRRLTALRDALEGDTK